VTAITSYLVKILVLLFLVAKYSGTTAFNGKLFGFTVIVCVIVWSAAQVLVSARLKVPYVEPDSERLKVPRVGPDGKRCRAVVTLRPDGIARPAGQAARCRLAHKSLAWRRLAGHDREEAAIGGWRAERRPYRLQLPAFGHAGVRRARLADLPLDRAGTDLPPGHAVRPRANHPVGGLPGRPGPPHAAPGPPPPRAAAPPGRHC